MLRFILVYKVTSSLSCSDYLRIGECTKKTTYPLLRSKSSPRLETIREFFQLGIFSIWRRTPRIFGYLLRVRYADVIPTAIGIETRFFEWNPHGGLDWYVEYLVTYFNTQLSYSIECIITYNAVLYSKY